MYFDPLFALLKNGSQVVIYSDNTDEGTVTVFPLAGLEDYDAEHVMLNTISATNVIRMGRDRATVFAEDRQTVKN